VTEHEQDGRGRFAIGRGVTSQLVESANRKKPFNMSVCTSVITMANPAMAIRIQAKTVTKLDRVCSAGAAECMNFLCGDWNAR